MDMIEHVDYPDFPGFEHIYLEDSLVLNVRVRPDKVEIQIDAVLLEEHPDYCVPPPDGEYCYQQGMILFEVVTKADWLAKEMVPNSDEDGSVDYGSIDWFFRRDDYYRIGGPFGELNIESAQPVINFRQ